MEFFLISSKCFSAYHFKNILKIFWIRYTYIKSNHLRLLSYMEFVIVSILRLLDVISGQGYLINVFILFMLVINNKSILYVSFIVIL